MNKCFIILLCCGLIIMSGCGQEGTLSDTQAQNDSTLIAELDHPLDPNRFGEYVREIQQLEEAVVSTYGDISITNKEICLEMALQNTNATTNPEYFQMVTPEEAEKIVLRHKKMIRDAEKRGITLDDDTLNQFLLSQREHAGVNSDGNVLGNESLASTLSEAGMTYFEYEENILKERLQYSLIQYDYAQAIYQELHAVDPSVEFGDDLVNSYLDALE